MGHIDTPIDRHTDTPMYRVACILVPKYLSYHYFDTSNALWDTTGHRDTHINWHKDTPMCRVACNLVPK